MEAIAYQALAETEEQGWYYQARLKAVHTLIKKYIKPIAGSLNILDIGCGTGGSTYSLKPYGKITGLEPSEQARTLLKQRFPDLNVVSGGVELVDSLLDKQTFDLSVILGVLYHKEVKDPGEALKKIASLQKPGSWIIWNEAAYPALKRHHDHTVHGARRFYPQTMKQLLSNAGYEVVHCNHLLAWAAPIAWLLARWDSISGGADDDSLLEQESADHKLPHPLVNFFLNRLTYLEWAASLLGIKFPFGVSYLILAQKTAETSSSLRNAA